MKHVVLSNGIAYFDCETVPASEANYRFAESRGF